MLTSQEAAVMTCQNSESIQGFLGEIKRVALLGLWSIALEPDAIGDDEEEALRMLGYSVVWNGSLLHYIVSWGNDR